MMVGFLKTLREIIWGWILPVIGFAGSVWLAGLILVGYLLPSDVFPWVLYDDYAYTDDLEIVWTTSVLQEEVSPDEEHIAFIRSKTATVTEGVDEITRLIIGLAHATDDTGEVTIDTATAEYIVASSVYPIELIADDVSVEWAGNRRLILTFCQTSFSVSATYVHDVAIETRQAEGCVREDQAMNQLNYIYMSEF